MTFTIRSCGPADTRWPKMVELFPRTIGYMRDPNDRGNYRFFAATDSDGTFLGGCVIDIGPLRFGPLKGTTAGFLEDIEVLDRFRRRGIGTALLRAALNDA